MEIKNVLKGIGRFLFWLFKIVAAVSITGLLVGALIILQEDLRGENRSLLSRSAIGAWLLALGTLLISLILYFVLRRLFRGLKSPSFWKLFGNSPVGRLLSLGLVSLIYPGTVYWAVRVPISTLARLLEALPQSIALSAQSASMGEGDIPVQEVFAQLLRLLQNVALVIAGALRSVIDEMPTADIVIALALWALAGHLFSGATAQTQDYNVVAYLKRLTATQRRNAIVALIFLGGIYLSIAAIVAIPGLRKEDVPESLSEKRLETALEHYRSPKAASDNNNVLPASAPDHIEDYEKALDTFEKQVQDLVGSSKDALVNANAASLKYQTAELRNTLNDMRANRQSAVAQLERLRADAAKNTDQIIDQAISDYGASLLSPLSVPQRAAFFSDVVESVRGGVGDIEQARSECEQAITYGDGNVVRNLKKFQSDTSQLDAKSLNALPLQLIAAWSGLRAPNDRMERSCESRQGQLPIRHQLPQPGAGWGPFSLVSQWLLRTQSTALALITGMLGFGLLGAVIASFITGASPSNPSDTAPAALSEEVARIVVRGLSAAIVVFLAAKGGLAIVSNGETEPNPYVLFFACLVGAVYSDAIWAWARREIAKRFPPKEDAADDTQGTPSNPNSPAAAATGKV